MKNFFSIITITLFILTLTGCKNSTPELTCTKDKNTAILKIKYNKLVTYTTETTTEYENKTALEMTYNAYQTTASSYNSIEGASAEVSKNENELTFRLTFNFKEMDKSTIKKLGLNKKAKDIIKNLEKEGYTCK